MSPADELISARHAARTPDEWQAIYDRKALEQLSPVVTIMGKGGNRGKGNAVPKTQRQEGTEGLDMHRAKLWHT